MTARGLSSLGRAESRVLPTLDAVAAVLAVLAGKATTAPDPDHAFFSGEERLASRTVELLGPSSQRRPVHFLVTAPSEAADGDGFMLRLAELGVEGISEKQTETTGLSSPYSCISGDTRTRVAAAASPAPHS